VVAYPEKNILVCNFVTVYCMNFIILLVTLKMFFLVSCLSSHEILATPLLLGKVQATNLFQLVELDLGKKYVVWNVVGSSKSTTSLVVGGGVNKDSDPKAKAKAKD